MPCNLTTEILKEITDFAKDSNVDRVVLFGSRARGNNTERSDIDIAVSGGDFDAFYRNIKDNIQSLFMFDVVDLNGSVSTDLRESIDKEGVVIYEKA